MASPESFFQRHKFDTTFLSNKNHRGVSGIYCIHNVFNDRFYIGSAVNLYVRMTVHLTHLRQNKHHNCFLQRDFSKCGEGALHFYVLKTTEKQLLLLEEQAILDKVFGEASCYNLNGIANSWLGRKHSEKTKSLLSIKAIGRRHSEATKKKMSESRKGVPLPKNHPIRMGQKFKTKEKIRNSMLGTKNHFFGKKHSVETKQKIRQSLLETRVKN